MNKIKNDTLVNIILIAIVLSITLLLLTKLMSAQESETGDKVIDNGHYIIPIEISIENDMGFLISEYMKIYRIVPKDRTVKEWQYLFELYRTILQNDCTYLLNENMMYRDLILNLKEIIDYIED